MTRIPTGGGIYAGRRVRHLDDPNVRAVCRAFDVPPALVVGHPWPRFTLFPRLARLHRRFR